MSIEEMLKQAIGDMLEGQGTYPHQHAGHISMSMSDEPLRCGSQYFLKINEYTFGFSKKEFVRFRDDIVEGVNATLKFKPPVSPTDNQPQFCVTCHGKIEGGNGFETTIGWMHFECEKGYARVSDS